jgi:hypothetical protein
MPGPTSILPTMIMAMFVLPTMIMSMFAAARLQLGTTLMSRRRRTERGKKHPIANDPTWT